MKILDVQGFTGEQQQKLRERQVSNFVRFTDKTALFPTVYNVNKTNSTAERGTNSIDQYVGPDSPVRYDKIKNFPVFGTRQITDETEYEKEDLGYNVSGVSIECYYPANVMDTYVGTCLVYENFNPGVLFIVDDVKTIDIKNKSFVKLALSILPADKLEQLERQVISNNTDSI